MRSFLSLVILALSIVFVDMKGVYPLQRPSFDPLLLLAQAPNIILITLIAGVVTYLGCWAIIRYETLHSSQDHADGSPQRFHASSTPRIGGLAIYVGLVVSSVLLGQKDHSVDRDLYGRLIVTTLPAFFIGISEDLGIDTGISTRLYLTMTCGALGVWLLGGVVNQLGLPGLDVLLQNYLPIAILMSGFAVGGLANAVNVIDGFNGLASGVTTAALLGCAGLAYQFNDTFILTLSLSLIGALVGFLIWNWPRGQIFLGDGGAYVLGVVLGEIGILMVHRHPEVSPWAILLILIHPVVETLYSIYRRAIHRGHGAGRPDRLHLHQLIYARLLRGNQLTGYSVAVQRLARNSAVAPLTCMFTLSVGLYAQWAFSSTLFSLLGVLIATLSYVVLYSRVVHWKTPSWLISRRRMPFLLRAAQSVEESQRSEKT